MENTSGNISSVEKRLEGIFSALNQKYFGNALEEPMIVVKSDSKSYQKVSKGKVWSSENVEHYEIRISAGVLNKSVEETVVAILHQCVHLWNTKCGVKDTSRAGLYHNKRFKESAEAHGLKVGYNERNGWSDIRASQELFDFIKCQQWEPFLLTRSQEKFDTSNKHQRKYCCPHCKKGVWATRKMRILCMDCNLQMIDAN